jgi:hypothetical protein
MSIALYAMFSLTKHFSKLCITLGFELMISCIPQGCANCCTTSVDTGKRLCMVLVCLLLYVGEIVTLRLVSDIRRGARRATQAGHCVTSMGLLGHLDSPGPESEVPALWTRSWSCHCHGGHQCLRPGPVPCAGTRLLKPDSTPLQNNGACGPGN